MAAEIISHFPKQIGTYYEPFVGGGSVFRRLIDSDIKYNKIVCSDINNDLIKLWINIRDKPKDLTVGYSCKWTELNTCKNEEDKENYYYSTRKEFNESRNTVDFLFLTRTSYSGLIRYNKKGEYNSPFHFNRPGMNPNMLSKIINDWSIKIQDVEFMLRPYTELITKPDDFVFMDPPYFNTSAQIYNGKILFQDYINFVSNLNCGYAITLDGKSDNYDKTCVIPISIYDRMIYISKQNSSMARLLNKNNYVQEALYIKETKLKNENIV